jgi:hypothetical protein
MAFSLVETDATCQLLVKFLGSISIARLFACCRQLCNLKFLWQAWHPLLRLTGWDVIPESFCILGRYMSMSLAACKLGQWRLLHGDESVADCSLSTILADLCTQASLIRAGFDVQAGDVFDVPAGDVYAAHEPASCFLVVTYRYLVGDPPSLRAVDDDSDDDATGYYDLWIHDIAVAFGKSLGIASLSDWGTQIDKYILGFASCSWRNDLVVCFDVRGYSFLFESTHWFINEFHRPDLRITSEWAFAFGQISVLAGGGAVWPFAAGTRPFLSWHGRIRSAIIGDLRSYKEICPWHYLDAASSNHNHMPFQIERPRDFKQLSQQMSDDVRVPLDALDKFVIAGFAGQLGMSGGPCSPTMRYYGDILFYLAKSLGVDDIPSLIPSWQQSRDANWDT